MNKEIRNQIICKFQNWWNINHGMGPAVIGISGGKDSSVVAALCVKALGRNNVLGVLMPDGEQRDISDSQKLCSHLKIKNITINIQEMTIAFLKSVHLANKEFIKDNSFKPRCDFSRYTTNIPPRVRMTMLYAIAQDLDGRVIGTGNAAETACGYFTYGGDCISDFNPLRNLFVDEVVELGKLLGLLNDLVEKKPSDGLSGKTDEDNLGFTYADVKKVVLKTDDWQINTPFVDIERRIKNNAFKLEVFHVPTIDFYRDKDGKILSLK